MDYTARVPHKTMEDKFNKILLRCGFSVARAAQIAGAFLENSLEGVPSHGLNRFPDFIKLCDDGIIDKDASPTVLNSMGALEVWDGNFGPGISNAYFSMGRAIELASEFGIGCVALRNTNHWMRGGTYGWQAANAGYISISFTNTMPLVVPWGGLEPRLGNNPLVIAVPSLDGHVVLDMAISQFAMGRVKNYNNADKELPMEGGYDALGNATKNPKEIVESGRLMPIGFWKGSGLALMLDLLTTTLSGGNSTADISKLKKESAVSQTYICFKPDSESPAYVEAIREILAYTKTSANSGQVRYPGEHTRRIRADNLKNGIPVDREIWEGLDNLE
ncbi:3-dehydro-L-gulonate 2-dehydrogenase [Pedobacter sp. UYP30]|uniref:3-dehydro-L-gulonate 2-dehydrogenase n=1 Tax=Pedobacter sp. UYP30 TaxID=1756400 RepID=UPI0033925DF7